MSVTEIKQAIGAWEVRLREDTPQQVLAALTFYGHIAILPGELPVAQYGDALLASARYVGVYRGRDAQDTFTLKGSGMAFWLGDEDGKGDVFEEPVVLTGATFPDSVRALLPPGGAVAEGTLHSVPGTLSQTFQWQNSRETITYVTDTFGAEHRVNHDGTLDAGTVSQLYVTVPKALLMRKGFGADLLRKAISGRMAMGVDVEDVTTRVVLLAEGEGSSIVTADADAPATPYKDLHGNPIRVTRLVSESGTEAANAAARAQLQLNRFLNARRSVQLSSNDYDIKGTFVVGDYLDVYDPENGFYDADRELYWQGERVNPMALRCVEMSWPVPPGWTVAFRDINGNWVDLSPYYIGESGDTTIVVGDLARGLASVGGEAVGVRPNLPDSTSDDTIPAAPEFTGFSTGVYESDHRTLSSVQAMWDQPLNADGSTITDGDHYELRYRPNAVMGTHVPWDFISGGYEVDYEDEFNVNSTGSFGSNWTPGSEFSASGGAANITHATFNAVRAPWYTGLACEDMEIAASHRIDYVPLGATTVMGSVLRWVSAGNHYWIWLEINPDLSVTVRITRYKGGVYSELASKRIPGMAHASGVEYWTFSTVVDDVVTTKVWQGNWVDQPEQDTLSARDPDPVTGSGYAAFMDFITLGATNPAGVQTKHPHFRMRNLAPDNPGSAYSWDDLGTWDAVTSPPVAVSPDWSIAYVGWDQTVYTLVELSPGIQYEFQIRAVDAASPPHASPWSVSSFVNTTGDVIAPDIPDSCKTIAASLIGVQVEHWLGKASGGVFNLPLDLDHLEVHAGDVATFNPDNSTRIGDLIATGVMIRGSVPAVGSFKVDQADTVWIRVVAVDRSGNKSGPSAATQSSVVLIDDAHISNLSVSKLTAGTITAQSVLAAQMEVGPGGNFKMTDGSMDVFWGQSGVKMVEVGQLSNGAFGLAAVDIATGELVDLATLAFGIRADAVTASGTLSGAGSMRDIPGSFGPEVTVTVGETGRCIVTVSAEIEIDLVKNLGLESASGQAGFQMLRVSDGVTAISATTSRAAVAELTYDTEGVAMNVPSLTLDSSATRVNLIEGLQPGQYVVTMKYFNISRPAIFRNRTLIVQPY